MQTCRTQHNNNTIHHTACGCLTWRHTSTQQELLVWKTSPRCVLVLKKLDATLDFQLDQVVAFLGLEEGLTVVVEAHDYRRMKAAYGWEFLESFDDDEKPQLHQVWGLGFLLTWVAGSTHELPNSFPHLLQVIDFVVCLGGDGVILHACTLFHSYVPPIIGFNLGSMGFLTNHEFDTFREDLRGVLSGGDQLEGCDTDDPDQGGVYVTLRMRLLCEVYRRGQHEPSEVHEVLNEVVVDRGSSPYLSKIECYERGRLVTRVQVGGWVGIFLFPPCMCHTACAPTILACTHFPHLKSTVSPMCYLTILPHTGGWCAAGHAHRFHGIQCCSRWQHGAPVPPRHPVYAHLPPFPVLSTRDPARLCRLDASDPG